MCRLGCSPHTRSFPSSTTSGSHWVSTPGCLSSGLSTLDSQRISQGSGAHNALIPQRPARSARHMLQSETPHSRPTTERLSQARCSLAFKCKYITSYERTWLMNHRLLWLGTTTLLALDLKRRRSNVTQAPTVTAGSRFSNDSQTTVGDVEKTNAFDVSPQQIRSTAEPLLPPSPEVVGESAVPFQPNEPTQYASRLTSDQASILTESEQTESEWSGLGGIDSVGSPVPDAHIANHLFFTRRERMEEARREVRQQDRALWMGATSPRL